MHSIIHVHHFTSSCRLLSVLRLARVWSGCSRCGSIGSVAAEGVHSGVPPLRAAWGSALDGPPPLYVAIDIIAFNRDGFARQDPVAHVLDDV